MVMLHAGGVLRFSLGNGDTAFESRPGSCPTVRVEQGDDGDVARGRCAALQRKNPGDELHSPRVAGTDSRLRKGRSFVVIALTQLRRTAEAVPSRSPGPN